MVFNRGDRAFDFGPENVRMIFNDRGDYVQMRTYEQVVRYEKKVQANRRGWAALLVGLGGVASAASAGNTYGSGTLENSHGRTIGSFSYSGNDAVAQQMSLDRTERQMADVAARMDAQYLANLRELDGMVQTTTLDPGAGYGGQLKIWEAKAMARVKGPYPVTFRIAVGDEVHLIQGTFEQR